MSTFAQDLREKVARSLLPQQQANPLRTIGLSSLILDLGLSDDELYEYSKDMARDLVVHFHPDRIGTAPSAVEHQRRFAGAFEALKDRQVFDGALQEFKQQHSEETSERSQEQQIAITQRALLDETKAKLEQAEITTKTTAQQLNSLKDRFSVNLKLRGTTLSKEVVSELKPAGIQQAVRLNLLVFDHYYSCTLPDRSVVSEYVEQYRSITASNGWTQRKRKRFKESLTAAKVGCTSVSGIISEALESDELFPAVNWSASDGYRRLGLRRFATGNPHRHESVSAPNTNMNLKELSVVYRKALASLGSLMARRNEGVESLSIRLESIEVNSGFINSGLYRYPILGTIPMGDINPLLFHLSQSDVPTEVVLEKLQPILVQGDLLVWYSHPTLSKIEEGESMANRLLVACSEPKHFNASCVVLESLIGDSD